MSGGLNPGNISVNGQRETANAFLVNGGDVSEGRNLGAGLVPNLDSIAEFRLITNSFDAEYGKFSGAVVNAITKSGTNGIHGDVFEFLRNDVLDARGYFVPAKSELRRNQFGFAVGGPVWKNHIFWFSDYQGTREVQGAETGLVTVPTLDARQGNFDPTTLTGTVDGAYWAQVLNTRLGLPAGTITQGEPYSFAGCSSNAACVFPVNSATGFANIPQQPGPHLPAISFRTFRRRLSREVRRTIRITARETRHDNKFGERIDFNTPRNGQLVVVLPPGQFERGQRSCWLRHGSWLPHVNACAGPGIRHEQHQDARTHGRQRGADHLFRNVLHKDNPAASFASLSSLGFVTGAGTLGIVPLAGYKEYVPQIQFSNSGLNIGVPTLNTFQPNTTYSISDVFSKSMGNHTLKFGGEFRYLQVNERNFANPHGGFTFNGGVTGDEFADYLLGATCTRVLLPTPRLPCSSWILGHVTVAPSLRMLGR